jgi:AcrR family transcriptional regulator
MTPRPPRDEVRARLLTAAGTVFATKGFAAASVEDVASAAGLTKGAIYSNFKGKDELFFALLGEHVANRFLAAADVQDISRVGDALMQAAIDDDEWQLLFLEFWLRAMRDPDARAQFVEHRRELREAIAKAIEERGVPLPMPARDLATLLLALSNGLAIEHLPDPGEVPTRLFGDVLAALAR